MAWCVLFVTHYMTFVSYLVYALITAATFVIGLSAFGYSKPWQLCIHIFILLVIVRFLFGCFNELVFRVNLDTASAAAANVYLSKKLPAPRKYGYKFDEPALESWHGQTYLEEICADASVDDLTRLEAKILVNDIHKAEWLDWTAERRLMRVALDAMKKYDRMLG